MVGRGLPEEGCCSSRARFSATRRIPKSVGKALADCRASRRVFTLGIVCASTESHFLHCPRHEGSVVTAQCTSTKSLLCLCRLGLNRHQLAECVIVANYSPMVACSAVHVLANSQSAKFTQICQSALTILRNTSSVVVVGTQRYRSFIRLQYDCECPRQVCCGCTRSSRSVGVLRTANCRTAR